MSGVINQGPGNIWGVCGFVGVLNALHEQGKLAEFGKTLTTDQIQERLGAEIITYLKMTEIDRPKVATAILKYTQSFGTPYSSYASIKDICSRLVVAMKAHTALGIGMPPSAVEDYMKWADVKSSMRTVGSSGFTRTELLKYKGCIVGCGRGPTTDPYNGLRHWVYVNPQGCLLNWGVSTDLTTTGLPQNVLDKKYTSVPAAIELT